MTIHSSCDDWWKGARGVINNVHVLAIRRVMSSGRWRSYYLLYRCRFVFANSSLSLSNSNVINKTDSGNTSDRFASPVDRSPDAAAAAVFRGGVMTSSSPVAIRVDADGFVSCQGPESRDKDDSIQWEPNGTFAYVVHDRLHPGSNYFICESYLLCNNNNNNGNFIYYFTYLLSITCLHKS